MVRKKKQVADAQASATARYGAACTMNLAGFFRRRTDPLKEMRMTPSRKKIWLALWLIAAVGAGVGARVWNLGKLSFWLDEGYSAWASSLSPGGILHVIRSDVSPPLYYLLLHEWRAVFGSSDAALRAMSAAAGVLGIGVFFLLARRVLRHGVAVAVALSFFSLSYFQVIYAREARAYGLMSLTALLSLYCLYRFLEGRSWWAFAGLVLSAAAGLYLHNIMFLYLAGLDAAWGVLALRRRENAEERDIGPSASHPAHFLPFSHALRDILLANVLIGLLYLPWLGSLTAQMHWVQGHFWVHQPDWHKLVECLGELLGVHLIFPGGGLRAPGGRMLPFLADTLRGGAILLAVLVWLASLKIKSRLRADVLALGIYAIGPVAMAFLYSQVRQPIFLARTLVTSSAILPLLLAIPCAIPMARWPRRVMAASVGMILMLCGLSTAYQLAFDKKEQWREASAYVRHSGLAGPRRLIVFVPSEGELLYRHYARQPGAQADSSATLSALPVPFLSTDPPIPARRLLTEQDIALLAGWIDSGRFDEIDLVLAHDRWSNPHRLPQRYLRRHWVLVDQKTFYLVWVQRYVRPGISPDHAFAH